MRQGQARCLINNTKKNVQKLRSQRFAPPNASQFARLLLLLLPQLLGAFSRARPPALALLPPRSSITGGQAYALTHCRRRCLLLWILRLALRLLLLQLRWCCSPQTTFVARRRCAAAAAAAGAVVLLVVGVVFSLARFRALSLANLPSTQSSGLSLVRSRLLLYIITASPEAQNNYQILLRLFRHRTF